MIALAVESNEAGTDAVIAYVAASLSCVALPVALRYPVVATLVQCAATATLDVAASEPRTEFPVMTICVLVCHVALVALRHPWQIAVGVWWTLAGLAVLLVAVSSGYAQTDADETLALVVLAAATLIALVGGMVYRYRLRIRGELAVARRDVEIEHERRTLAEERTRIARELHDVVAHSMSVIHMQATSAPYRLADVDPETRAEFTAIAAGARGAIGEMRQLLGVLRETDAAPETVPTPGLDRLPELVEVTSRYGGPVTLAVEPDLGQVPDTVGTTVYRIVQEALSNVVRHARGASTTVRVSRDWAVVVVSVVNTRPADARDAVGRRPVRVEATDDPTRPRHGVTGMRERAARLGGDFTHGPTSDGGYRVAARLPLPATSDSAGGAEGRADRSGAGDASASSNDDDRRHAG
jgi:signal transduction histidine kinase